MKEKKCDICGSILVQIRTKIWQCSECGEVYINADDKDFFNEIETKPGKGNPLKLRF